MYQPTTESTMSDHSLPDHEQAAARSKRVTLIPGDAPSIGLLLRLPADTPALARPPRHMGESVLAWVNRFREAHGLCPVDADGANFDPRNPTAEQALRTSLVEPGDDRAAFEATATEAAAGLPTALPESPDVEHVAPAFDVVPMPELSNIGGAQHVGRGLRGLPETLADGRVLSREGDGLSITLGDPADLPPVRGDADPLVTGRMLRVSTFRNGQLVDERAMTMDTKPLHSPNPDQLVNRLRPYQRAAAAAILAGASGPGAGDGETSLGAFTAAHLGEPHYGDPVGVPTVGVGPVPAAAAPYVDADASTHARMVEHGSRKVPPALLARREAETAAAQGEVPPALAALDAEAAFENGVRETMREAAHMLPPEPSPEPARGIAEPVAGATGVPEPEGAAELAHDAAMERAVPDVCDRHDCPGQGVCEPCGEFNDHPPSRQCGCAKCEWSFDAAPEADGLLQPGEALTPPDTTLADNLRGMLGAVFGVPELRMPAMTATAQAEALEKLREFAGRPMELEACFEGVTRDQQDHAILAAAADLMPEGATEPLRRVLLGVNMRRAKDGLKPVLGADLPKSIFAAFNAAHEAPEPLSAETSAALAVACPRCGADVGHGCTRTTSGYERRPRGPHTMRREAAVNAAAVKAAELESKREAAAAKSPDADVLPAEAVLYPCERCGAQPGHACVGVVKNAGEVRAPHEVRLQAVLASRMKREPVSSEDSLRGRRRKTRALQVLNAARAERKFEPLEVLPSWADVDALLSGAQTDLKGLKLWAAPRGDDGHRRLQRAHALFDAECMLSQKRTWTEQHGTYSLPESVVELVLGGHDFSAAVRVQPDAREAADADTWRAAFDRALSETEAEWLSTPARRRAHAAERTLERLGWEHRGGIEWAPPVGAEPGLVAEASQPLPPLTTGRGVDLGGSTARARMDASSDEALVAGFKRGDTRSALAYIDRKVREAVEPLLSREEASEGAAAVHVVLEDFVDEVLEFVELAEGEGRAHKAAKAYVSGNPILVRDPGTNELRAPSDDEWMLMRHRALIVLNWLRSTGRVDSVAELPAEADVGAILDGCPVDVKGRSVGAPVEAWRVQRAVVLINHSVRVLTQEPLPMDFELSPELVDKIMGGMAYEREGKAALILAEHDRAREREKAAQAEAVDAPAVGVAGWERMKTRALMVLNHWRDEAGQRELVDFPVEPTHGFVADILGGDELNLDTGLSCGNTLTERGRLERQHKIAGWVLDFERARVGLVPLIGMQWELSEREVRQILTGREFKLNGYLIATSRPAAPVVTPVERERMRRALLVLNWYRAHVERWAKVGPLVELPAGAQVDVILDGRHFDLVCGRLDEVANNYQTAEQEEAERIKRALVIVNAARWGVDPSMAEVKSLSYEVVDAVLAGKDYSLPKVAEPRRFPPDLQSVTAQMNKKPEHLDDGVLESTMTFTLRVAAEDAYALLAAKTAAGAARPGGAVAALGEAMVKIAKAAA